MNTRYLLSACVLLAAFMVSANALSLEAAQECYDQDYCPTKSGSYCQFGCNCWTFTISWNTYTVSGNKKTDLMYNVTYTCNSGYVKTIEISVEGLTCGNPSASYTGKYTSFTVTKTTAEGFDVFKYSAKTTAWNKGETETFIISGISGNIPDDYYYAWRGTSSLSDETFYVENPLYCQPTTTKKVATSKALTTNKVITSKALTTSPKTTKALTTDEDCDVTTKPITSKAVTSKALTTDDLTTKPLTTKPITSKAVTTKALTTDEDCDVTTKPITSKSVTSKALTTDDLTTQPLTTKPITSQAITSKAVTSKGLTTGTNGYCNGRAAYICNVILPSFCAGDSYCPPDPVFNFPGYSTPYGFDNYNAISFDDFYAPYGDVEGRLAARNDITVSSYTVGLQVNYGTCDIQLPYSLVNGHTGSYTYGSVLPNTERIFAGTSFTAQQYLSDRADIAGSNVLDDNFDDAQDYYRKLQAAFDAVPDNAVTTWYYGALKVTCNSNSQSSYTTTVDGASFSVMNGYTTFDNCNMNAQFIFNIIGTGDVIFTGGQFSHDAETVLYNIIGSGRTVRIKTGVTGNILGPDNYYYQDTGVPKGLVIMGNFLNVAQINKPCCTPRTPQPAQNCYMSTTKALTTQPLTTQPLTTKPLTTKAVTSQPLTTQPVTSAPLTTQPLTTQALTTQPLTTQPLTTKPLTTQAVTSQPLTTQPLTTQPLTTQPLTTQALTTQPLTTKDITTQPLTTQPLTTQALTTQPLTTKDITTQPLTTQPLTTKPLTTQAVTSQPLTTQPLTTQPLTTQSLTTQALTTQPLTTKDITTQPLTTQPLTTQAVTSQPLTTQPLTTQPLTTQPLTTQALTTQPLTTQPLTTQPLTTAPLTTQPLTTQALTTQPLTTQPLTTAPLTTQPLTTKDITTQPLTTQALTTQPLTTKDITTQPLTTQPLTTQPLTTKDITTQPLTTQALTTQPLTTQPLTTAPLTTQPLTTQPLTTQAVTSQPLTTQPLTTAPLTTQPLTTQELTTQPLTTAPLTTQPLTTQELTTQPLTTAPLTTQEITSAPLTTAPLTTQELTTAPLTTQEVTSGPLTTQALTTGRRPPSFAGACAPFYEPSETCSVWQIDLQGRTINFGDYSVISFSEFNANTGDTEGRIAVKGTINVGYGFSFGEKVNTSDANHVTLISGKHLYWGSGSLLPANSVMFVGGNTTMPDYLLPQKYNTYCYNSNTNQGCLDAEFDTLRTCYQSSANDLVSTTPNTYTTLLPGGELKVTCYDDTLERYYVNIDVSDFNQISSYSLENCNVPHVQYVITVTGGGNNDVLFNGAPFPDTNATTIYVIPGPRTIRVNVGVNGGILAPDATLIQAGGVIIGKVVVYNVVYMVQFNVPCVESDTTPTNPPSTPRTGCYAFYEPSECAGIYFNLEQYNVNFQDYEVISFGNFTGNTGDTEGRTAVRDFLKVGYGFSFGEYVGDFNGNPVSLIVGRDGVWGSGALLPEEAWMYVGGVMDSPSYLLDWKFNQPCYGCTDRAFDDGKACYKAKMDSLIAEPTNAVASIVPFTGGQLQITCDGNATRYYIHLDSSVYNQARFYSMVNCNVHAQYVVVITGSGDVIFDGAEFPVTEGGAVFLVPGTRTITAKVGVQGGVVAPDATLDQTGGVIKGKVVAGNIKNVLQFNIPCTDQEWAFPPTPPTPPTTPAPTTPAPTTPAPDLTTQPVTSSPLTTFRRPSK